MGVELRRGSRRRDESGWRGCRPGPSTAPSRAPARRARARPGAGPPRRHRDVADPERAHRPFARAGADHAQRPGGLDRLVGPERRAPAGRPAPRAAARCGAGPAPAPRRRAARPAASRAPAGTSGASPLPISDATSDGGQHHRVGAPAVERVDLGAGRRRAPACRAGPPDAGGQRPGGASIRAEQAAPLADHPVAIQPAEHQRRQEPEAAEHLERGGRGSPSRRELQGEPRLVARAAASSARSRRAPAPLPTNAHRLRRPSPNSSSPCGGQPVAFAHPSEGDVRPERRAFGRKPDRLAAPLQPVLQQLQRRRRRRCRPRAPAAAPRWETRPSVVRAAARAGRRPGPRTAPTPRSRRAAPARPRRRT